METVSLAFDFLKDETGSIFTENEGNTEHVQIKQPIKNSPYRFQVPQMTAVTKSASTTLLLHVSLINILSFFL